jgi:hypothetical protein
MRRELGIDPIAIDVGTVLQRTVASLYSHLVTRPTGRAVRLAIETQLAEARRTSLSLIDLSEVTVLDFSCADEVIAKLLLRFLEEDRPSDAFFVFRGVSPGHRGPIETVLERQALLAVAESHGRFELVGSVDPIEASVWQELEARGRVEADEVSTMFTEDSERQAFESLVRKRVAFRAVASGATHALSTLVTDIP